MILFHVNQEKTSTSLSFYNSCGACHVKHPLSTLNLTLSSICIVTFSYMKLLNYCMEWANYVQQLPLSSQFLMISMHL